MSYSMDMLSRWNSLLLRQSLSVTVCLLVLAANHARAQNPIESDRPVAAIAAEFPDDTDRARTLMRDQNWPKAAAEIKKALEKNQTNVGLYNDLGVCLINQQD